MGEENQSSGDFIEQKRSWEATKKERMMLKMEDGGDDNVCGLDFSPESSIEEEDGSRDSQESLSLSSCDLLEDASSSACSSSPSFSSKSTLHSSSSASSTSFKSRHGPLYELSELMTHLPMKRGLSRYYDGRSQSFTSLASVKSVEDLVKKQKPFIVRSKRLKMCNGYGSAGGFDNNSSGRHNVRSPVYSPKAVISKKGSPSSSPSSRASFLSSSSPPSLGKWCTSVSTRPPINPILKTF